MEIKLKSAVIRPWLLSDAETLPRYANNRKIWVNLRDIFPHPYTLEHARQFLEMVTQENPATTFAIVTVSEPIGSIRLKLGSDIHRKSAELGYWLAEPFWGRGIMSEAGGRIYPPRLRDVRSREDLRRAAGQYPASVRVLEKVGFVREARLRSNVFKDGKLQDSFLYAILRAEALPKPDA